LAGTDQKPGNGIKIAKFRESESILSYQDKDFTEISKRIFSLPLWGVRISSLKIFIFFCFFVLGVSFSGAQTTEERQASGKKEGPYKVAILPVAINSPENLEFMREGLLDMLSSRIFLEGRVEVLEKRIVKKAISGLSGEIDAEAARKLGAQLEVDYVVFGSLTKLGDSASLDLKVVDIKGEKAPSAVFVQAKKMEEVINGADEIARKVDEKILGYPLTPPVAVAKKVDEKILGYPLTPPGAVAKVESPPAPLPGFRPAMPSRGQETVVSAEFWQSQSFPYRVKGMAVGDFDGDGQNEVAMIGNRDLYIYRLDKAGFVLVKKFEGDKLDNYLAVDAGDINKDGTAEIFVTNLQKDSLQSFVVTFGNGAYQKTVKDQDWFYRVVEWGDRGSVLLGQGKGSQSGFAGPIYEMAWDGKKYKDVRKIEAPQSFSLYGFGTFGYQDQTYYIFIDPQFRLRVTDTKGKDVWKSQTLYGTDISFQARPLLPGTRGVAEGDEFEYINVRVIVRKNEVLILKNNSPIGQLFKRTKYYTGGEVQSLVWTGAMFTERWRSQEIPGYLVDLQVRDLDGKPGSELIVAVNLPREGILSGYESSALMVSPLKESAK
jgi:TolB-like protein